MSFVYVSKDGTINSYDDYEAIYSTISHLLEQYLSSYKKKSGKELFCGGKRVIIKPNFVHEMNFLVRFDLKEMDRPNDCFITNWNVVKAVIQFLSRYNNLTITLLECPLQSCNIDLIVTEERMDELKAFSETNTIEFVDGRRTKYVFQEKEPLVLHNLRSEDKYVDFDLGLNSEHSAFESKVDRFRVTDYPPSEMKKFHRQGVHCYRIAREVIEADIVISIPKFKTHMKAGMTASMKNFVGIVGNKECLPHHTKGSPLTGGDCYGDFSLIKQCIENILDRANQYLLEDTNKYYMIHKRADFLRRVRGWFCLDTDVEGSWYGNDTICRTIVDLNKIIYFGSIDGVLHPDKQREVISLVDGFVSGQGDGPMRPIPNYSKLFAISDSTALADIVCAELVGIDSRKIAYLKADRITNNSFPIIEEQEKNDYYFNDEKVNLDFFQRYNSNIIMPNRWGRFCLKTEPRKYSYANAYLIRLLGVPKRILRKVTGK